jgi:hypothetical protein
MVRETCSFLTLFHGDQDPVWLTWSADLALTVQFETFCALDPSLKCLLLSAAQVKTQHAFWSQEDMDVDEGSTVFVNIRWFSHTWYQTLPLPDLYTTNYVVKMFYGPHVGVRRKAIELIDPVFNNHFKGKQAVNHVWWRMFGQYSRFSQVPKPAKLVDAALLRQFPALLPEVAPPAADTAPFPLHPRPTVIPPSVPPQVTVAPAQVQIATRRSNRTRVLTTTTPTAFTAIGNIVFPIDQMRACPSYREDPIYGQHPPVGVPHNLNIWSIWTRDTSSWVYEVMDCDSEFDSAPVVDTEPIVTVIPVAPDDEDPIEPVIPGIQSFITNERGMVQTASATSAVPEPSSAAPAPVAINSL